MELVNLVPEILIQFLIVLFVSLLIGLEQRRIQSDSEDPTVPFGTDRTFTFIGVLGFIFYVLDPHTFIPFITGLVILGILFSIYYLKKIEKKDGFGITKIMVGLITYSLAPVVITQPKWFTALIIVSVLILVESKSILKTFTTKLANDEFITLGKFLLIAAVILPILPDKRISDFINVSPYQIWLSLVVVSGISYMGYILQKFVFRKSGLLVSGLIGGLYSSTATTVVLSKKSRENENSFGIFGASIVFASAIMYVRILTLAFIFNTGTALKLLPYIIIMTVVSIGTGLLIYSRYRPDTQQDTVYDTENNPLELKIAVVFSVLFILFSTLTTFTLEYFGEQGLNILSFIVGLTDIDPFLLNLFQGNYHIGTDFIARSTMQAIISNNVLKAIYGVILAEKKTKKLILLGLGTIIAVNILLLFFI